MKRGNKKLDKKSVVSLEGFLRKGQTTACLRVGEPPSPSRKHFGTVLIQLHVIAWKSLTNQNEHGSKTQCTQNIENPVHVLKTKRLKLLPGTVLDYALVISRNLYSWNLD